MRVCAEDEDPAGLQQGVGVLADRGGRGRCGAECQTDVLGRGEKRQPSTTGV